MGTNFPNDCCAESLGQVATWLVFSCNGERSAKWLSQRAANESIHWRPVFAVGPGLDAWRNWAQLVLV